MDIASLLTTSLGLGAAGTLVLFVLAVLADDIAGIVLAKKQGKFDPKKLGSFLESEFGTVRLLIVLGAVAVAVATALVAAPLTGSILVLASTLGKLALATATAGSAANIASVLADLKDKLTELTK